MGASPTQRPMVQVKKKRLRIGAPRVMSGSTLRQGEDEMNDSEGGAPQQKHRTLLEEARYGDIRQETENGDEQTSGAVDGPAEVAARSSDEHAE
ncbi:hypothetical protein NDU88_003059 [Pleurodeles waltl]|uniref:Uncharacterized protein n=1 Tax=Pleurodeles waltl TaxID=8319 RepID=A0AAV7VEA3_PLEWA|nr:hypothetical protein NDU88_003059 [Pleurodeles waltl]